jgi:Domain of unknown function (DUF4331)
MSMRTTIREATARSAPSNWSTAGTLLPDILPCDPREPASYPANGRTLTDDAIDVFLSILTNGKVTRDNVGPHTDLLASFPYVGGPHKARSA